MIPLRTLFPVAVVAAFAASAVAETVAIDYVQQLRRSWGKVARLTNFHGRVALDHGKGMVLEARGDGSIKTHVLNTHCWSAGLAISGQGRAETH